MWIRMRFDLGWRDLISGFVGCLWPGRRSRALRKAQNAWSESDEFLVTLSVRSGFDLTLRALDLPAGSEVLMSALTVPDMVRIVESHELKPVPVDVDERGQLIPAALEQAVSPQSRMLVIAHLFGSRLDLDDIARFAQQHELMLVEDLAQSFRCVGDRGHPASDLALFSFGPIKTATALGGAVVQVKQRKLRQKMSNLLDGDPIQSRRRFGIRISRFAVLKLLSGRLTSQIVKWSVERCGVDFDNMANASARGFSKTDLLNQLRRQPSIPLLRLLRRRWSTYNTTRIDRRIALGRTLDRELIDLPPPDHTYWIYPVFCECPDELCRRLRAKGFDATRLARMSVVPTADENRQACRARWVWEHAVVLPWYPELNEQAIMQMAEIVREEWKRKAITTERVQTSQPAPRGVTFDDQKHDQPPTLI